MISEQFHGGTVNDEVECERSVQNQRALHSRRELGIDFDGSRVRPVHIEPAPLPVISNQRVSSVLSQNLPALLPLLCPN